MQCQVRAASLLQGLHSSTCQSHSSGQEFSAPGSKVCAPVQGSLPVPESRGRAEHPENPDSLEQHSYFPTQLILPPPPFIFLVACTEPPFHQISNKLDSMKIPIMKRL